MSSNKANDNILELIKFATRAVSNNKDMAVSFSEPDASGKSIKNKINLPKISSADLKTKSDINLLKALADRAALFRRYEIKNFLITKSGKQISFIEFLNTLSFEQKQALVFLESLRVQVLGGEDFKGMKKSLEDLSAHEGSKFLHLDTLPYSYLLVTKLKSKILKTKRSYLVELISKIKILEEDIKVLNWLDFATKNLKNKDKIPELYLRFLNLLDDVESKNQQDIQSDEGEKNKLQASAEFSDEEISKQIEGDRDNTIEDITETETSEGLKQESSEDVQTSDDSAGALEGILGQALSGKTSFKYQPYTTEFDVVAHSEELVSKDELEKLSLKFKNITRGSHKLITNLATKLKRHLLNPTRVGWKFEQEEGILDPKRLTQVITSTEPRPYMLPAREEVADTSVTLLIDNSGSMRGRPIEMAAMSAFILANVLEMCGVTVEVLGFTTKTWKGGQSRIKWYSEGSEESPGRLNDILYLIFKSADESLRRAKKNFPAMLADDILKENIDGESLQWAYKRLMRRTEGRKILMVISDGAPVDYATDKHNIEGFLDAHLREVISKIEKSGDVELLAIGIGHDVSDYYSKAMTISSPDLLAEALVDNLVSLFKV